MHTVSADKTKYSKSEGRGVTANVALSERVGEREIV